jgi:hypothetical protein
MDTYYIIALVLFLLALPKFMKYIVQYYLFWRKRSEKNSLAGQVLGYRKELKTISQVDEFAKYSKIQRKLKVVEQQYNDHMRKDLELQLTYIALGKGLSYLLTVIFSVVLVYRFLAATLGLLTLGNEIISS